MSSPFYRVSVNIFFVALVTLSLTHCSDSGTARPGHLVAKYYQTYQPVKQSEYLMIKNALDRDKVTVNEVRWKLGGVAEGILHDGAVGETFIFLDVTLNSPDDESARRICGKVLQRFKDFVWTKQLGFYVHYVSIQFHSPDYYLEDSKVQNPVSH